MGLDAVEIIIEIEDAFGITISDDVAARIRTVGELYDYIIDCDPELTSRQGVCLTAATFYGIRRAVCAELGVPRRSIRPCVELEATVPRGDRRRWWRRLQDALAWKLPPLARPAGVVRVAGAWCVATSAAVGYLAFGSWGKLGAAAAAITTLFAAGLVAKSLTEPLESEFRPGFATFGGLSHIVLAHNYVSLSRQFESSTASDVWEAMKAIIVEQLGVRPELVTREARLVDDLGML